MAGKKKEKPKPYSQHSVGALFGSIKGVESVLRMCVVKIKHQHNGQVRIRVFAGEHPFLDIRDVGAEQLRRAKINIT